MSCTQRFQDANGGLDDVVQSFHLAHLADAGLEESHLRFLVKQPYRQGYANL